MISGIGIGIGLLLLFVVIIFECFLFLRWLLLLFFFDLIMELWFLPFFLLVKLSSFLFFSFGKIFLKLLTLLTLLKLFLLKINFEFESIFLETSILFDFLWVVFFGGAFKLILLILLFWSWPLFDSSFWFWFWFPFLDWTISFIFCFNKG